MPGEWELLALDKLATRDLSESKNLPYYLQYMQLCKLLQQNPARHDLIILVNERDELQSRLNSSAHVHEQLAHNAADAANEILRLKLQVSDLTKKLQDADTTVLEKNKTIESINDQIVLLQMQISVLLSKNDRVTAENKSLILRWIEKVAQDAEVLNNANERSAAP